MGAVKSSNINTNKVREVTSFGGWEDIVNSGANDIIANATSFTVGSLTNGRTYNFRVRAVNGEG